MRLLEANRINLVGVSRKEALEALMKSSDMLHVIVCDGPDDRPATSRPNRRNSWDRIQPFPDPHVSHPHVNIRPTRNSLSLDARRSSFV
jgi:hypothetical protein